MFVLFVVYQSKTFLSMKDKPRKSGAYLDFMTNVQKLFWDHNDAE